MLFVCLYFRLGLSRLVQDYSVNVCNGLRSFLVWFSYYFGCL